MKETSPRIATTLLKKLAASVALGVFLLTSPVTIVPQKSAYAEVNQEEKKKDQSELEKKVDAALGTYNLGAKLDGMYTITLKDEVLQAMLNTLNNNNFKEFIGYIKEEHKEMNIETWVKATKMLKEKFLKNYPKLAKSFSDYSLPSELPSLVLKYGK